MTERQIEAHGGQDARDRELGPELLQEPTPSY
jgi:hypothetical protein